jgi:hypothetical protein
MAIAANNRAQLSLRATTKLSQKNALDLVRAAAGEGATTLRVGGLETYRTNQPT